MGGHHHSPAHAAFQPHQGSGREVKRDFVVPKGVGAALCGAIVVTATLTFKGISPGTGRNRPPAQRSSSVCTCGLESAAPAPLQDKAAFPDDENEVCKNVQRAHLQHDDKH